MQFSNTPVMSSVLFRQTGNRVPTRTSGDISSQYPGFPISQQPQLQSYYYQQGQQPQQNYGYGNFDPIQRNSSQQSPDDIQQFPDDIQQPQSSVQQPSNTVQQPTNTVQQPSGTVQQPSNTVQQPSNTVQQPSNTVQQPSNTVQQPSNTVQQPSNTVQQPQSSVQQPQSSVQQPPNTVQQPSNTVQQPTNAIQQSTNSSQQTPNSTQITPSSAQQSSVQQSGTSLREPTSLKQQSRQTFQEPIQSISRHPFQARLSTQQQLNQQQPNQQQRNQQQRNQQQPNQQQRNQQQPNQQQPNQEQPTQQQRPNQQQPNQQQPNQKQHTQQGVNPKSTQQTQEYPRQSGESLQPVDSLKPDKSIDSGDDQQGGGLPKFLMITHQGAPILMQAIPMTPKIIDLLNSHGPLGPQIIPLDSDGSLLTSQIIPLGSVDPNQSMYRYGTIQPYGQVNGGNPQFVMLTNEQLESLIQSGSQSSISEDRGLGMPSRYPNKNRTYNGTTSPTRMSFFPLNKGYGSVDTTAANQQNGHGIGDRMFRSTVTKSPRIPVVRNNGFAPSSENRIPAPGYTFSDPTRGNYRQTLPYSPNSAIPVPSDYSQMSPVQIQPQIFNGYPRLP